jgi:hypothetical protein
MIWWILLSTLQAQEMPFSAASGRTSLALEYTDTNLTETRLQAAVPVYKSERSVWSVSARGQAYSLGETLVIADRNFSIPKDFGGAELGFGASFPREGGTRGFNASLGTTGRRLFEAENSRVISLTYFSEWKTAPDTSWYFFLSYSNNRTTFNNIPLPGFAYGIQRESLRFMAGFPFVFLSWMPRPWFLNMALSPFSSGVDAAYSVHGPWQATASVSWQPRSFQNLAPNVDGERLMFDRKEAAAGVRAAFGPLHAVTLAYVYQFDREFFIGKSMLEKKSGAAALEDSGGIQLKVRTAF